MDTSAHAKIPLGDVRRGIDDGGCRPADSGPAQAMSNPTPIEAAKLLLSRLTEPDLIPPDVVIGTFNRDTEKVTFERPPCQSVGIAGYSGSTSLRDHALRVHGPLPPSAHGDIKVMFLKADSKAWRVLVDIPYMYAKSRIPQLPDPSELSKVDDKWLFIGYTTSLRSPSRLESEREDEADDKRNSIGGRSILALPSPRLAWKNSVYNFRNSACSVRISNIGSKNKRSPDHVDEYIVLFICRWLHSYLFIIASRLLTIALSQTTNCLSILYCSTE